MDTQDQFDTVFADAISMVVADGNMTFIDDNLNVEKGSITADEVWNCAEQAVIGGFASFASLKNLKSMGIKVFTKASIL